MPLQVGNLLLLRDVQFWAWQNRQTLLRSNYWNVLFGRNSWFQSCHWSFPQHSPSLLQVCNSLTSPSSLQTGLLNPSLLPQTVISRRWCLRLMPNTDCLLLPLIIYVVGPHLAASPTPQLHQLSHSQSFRQMGYVCHFPGLYSLFRLPCHLCSLQPALSAVLSKGEYKVCTLLENKLYSWYHLFIEPWVLFSPSCTAESSAQNNQHILVVFSSKDI